LYYMLSMVHIFSLWKEISHNSFIQKALIHGMHLIAWI
jgi:hypothetical protein